MKTFKNQLAEAAGKNTHMIHIEDLIIDGGVKGARQASSHSGRCEICYPVMQKLQ